MASKMKRVPKFTGVYTYETEKVMKDENGKTKKISDKSYYINYKDERGKSKFEKIGRKSEGFTATYAHQKRNERVQQIKHGETVSKKKLSLNQIFDNYYLPEIKKSKKSYVKDEQRYNKRIRDSIGAYDINKINAKIIQKLKTELQNTGISIDTVGNYLRTIRQILNFAKVLGFFTGENVFKNGTYDNGVKIDKPKVERERYLTETEIQHMLDYFCLESRVTYEFSLLAVYSGMRNSEIRKLQWKNIDMTNKNIILEKSETKGKISRSIPMHDKIYRLFSKKEQGEGYEYIWDNDGKPLYEIPRPFKRYTDEIFSGTGSEKVVFHSLRHSFASHMAMKGTPITILQKLLGHASINQTMKYSHLIPDYSVKFIQELNY